MIFYTIIYYSYIRNHNLSTSIYFDESGFTGENLLDPNQIHFIYASVVTTDDESDVFIEKIMKKYKLQGSELKGTSLVNSTRGKKAIIEIMEHYKGNMLAAVVDKKFALSCKFFEYVFEPIIADKSSLFYQLGFHKFIANMIHLHYYTNNTCLEEMYNEFNLFIRKGVTPQFILSDDPDKPVLESLTQIFEFAKYHQEKIISESSSLPNWTLDVTTTSLLTLLSEWSTTHKSIKAICDSSKPLKADEDMLAAMHKNNGELLWFDNDGIKAVGFNLCEPISLVDSKESCGVQIADTIAAAVSYSLKNDDDFSQHIRLLYPEILSNSNIAQDFEYLNLDKKSTILNVVLLIELHTRSVNNLPILDGLDQYIHFISNDLENFDIKKHLNT